MSRQWSLALDIFNDLLARDGQKAGHFLADLNIRAGNASLFEVTAHLAHNVIIARLFQIRDHDGLGIGFSISVFQAQKFCRPQAKQLVAARIDLELGFLIQGIAGFLCAFAIIECAHGGGPFTSACMLWP